MQTLQRLLTSGPEDHASSSNYSIKDDFQKMKKPVEVVPDDSKNLNKAATSNQHQQDREESKKSRQVSAQTFKDSEHDQEDVQSEERQIFLGLGAQQLTFQSAQHNQPLGSGHANPESKSKIKLMLTNSDEEFMADETTKNVRRMHQVSKSEQKMNIRQYRANAKIETAGPSPMSFGNMMEEVMMLESNDDAMFGAPNSNLQALQDELLGAASGQMLFPTQNMRVAGDQGSSPSQSGGSISEDPMAPSSKGGGNTGSNQERNAPRQAHQGILRTSFEQSVPLRRTNTVQFKNRLKRATSAVRQKDATNESNINNAAILKLNKSSLSQVSRATSNASYTVKTQTGAQDQYLLGKLPVSQPYALLQSIESEQLKQRSIGREGNQESSNLKARFHSPVLEQQTLEQAENSFSSTSPPIQPLQIASKERSSMRSKYGKKPAQFLDPNTLQIHDQSEALRVIQSATHAREIDQDMATNFVYQRTKTDKKIEGARTGQHLQPVPFFDQNCGEKRLFLRSEKINPAQILGISNNNNPNMMSTSTIKEHLENNSLDDDFARASDAADDADANNLAIIPKLIMGKSAPISNQVNHGGRQSMGGPLLTSKKEPDAPQYSNAKPLALKVTTMSQAESYFPEHDMHPRMTKLSIFGDPWNTSKNRNKNLITELMKGNQEEESQKQLEQATIIFNDNPHKGIQFCIEQRLFSNRSRSIAKFLQKTSGLSKFAIGQYLASPNEMNQQVLEIFASHIAYKDKAIDEAIRQFLATFRLPGEGDQIQRIIEKFSAAYRKENPEHFDDEDQAFLLAYCLIFLNTLNHNPNVDPKNRLTLAMFLKQCNSAAPRYPKAQLEQIYQRICTNQFKTDTQDIERILGRVGPFFNIDPEKPLTKDHDIQMVQRGAMFVKYGRRGQPHSRFVYISPDEQYLVWCIKTLSVITSASTADHILPQSKKESNKVPGSTTPGKESKIRRIPLDEILDIKVGITATGVLKRHGLPKELDNVCMSVITSSRTLDLKANDSQTRNKWVQYFYDRVLKERLEQADRPSLNSIQGGAGPLIPFGHAADSEVRRKHTMNNRYTAYQRAWGNDEQQLEYIWVHNIMTNIEAHWDYVNDRPKSKGTYPVDSKKRDSTNGKNIGPSSQQNQRRSSLLSCFSCTRSVAPSSPGHRLESRNKLKNSHQAQKFNSPEKRRQSNDIGGLGGVTTLQKLQSVRSEGSFEELSQHASPYLNQLLSASKNHQSSSARGEQNLQGSSPSNVEVQMEDLWRFGIPVSVRRVLWPFKIGNKLGVSKELYQINRLQGVALRTKVQQLSDAQFDIVSSSQESHKQQSLHSQVSASNINASQSGRVLDLQTLHQIHEDIDDFFEVTDCLSVVPKTKFGMLQVAKISVQGESAGDSDIEVFQEAAQEMHQGKDVLSAKKESLMNLILAFLVYRPDVGYVKNMSFLAGTLLTYCEEARAFICFANFVHEKLFIQLFRGYVQDIKLRIDLFDSYFRESMPELHQHFEALEIDTAFFLTDWFVTVFVKNMDFKIACRIWDNMILDGEIFAFKTGLGILAYFESKFLKQCHFQIKEQLSNMRGLVDEHRLFAIIEGQIDLDQAQFLAKCQSQTWGHQKAKLLGFANDYLSEFN